MKDDFHAILLQQLEDYKIHLTDQKLSIGAINGHLRVGNLFINHIHNFTNYTQFEDISVAHATTKFLAHVKWDGLSDWKPKEIKIKLIVFIAFLATRGFKNEAILEGLKK
jgi:hypothetical protein